MIQSAESRAEAAARPAVAYLRRSTDKQEQSIADQRAEIERYAANLQLRTGQPLHRTALREPDAWH